MRLTIQCALIFSICVTVLTGCRFPWQSPIHTEVGQYKITEKDLAYRQKVAKIFYPNENRPDLGLIQLTQAFTFAQIMAQNGAPITDKMLQEEDERINTSTKDPKTLNQVQEIFGVDHESYMKVFVLPTYVERTIYFDFFLKNPKLQAGTQAPAVAFFQKVFASPQTILAEAKKQNLVHSRLWVSEKHGLEWVSLEKTPAESSKGAGKLIDQSPNAKAGLAIEEQLKAAATAQEKIEALRWINELITPTKPGDIINTIIDNQTTWQVIRYVGPDIRKNAHLLEVVAFPKLDYGKWLEEEKAKVKIVKH